MTVSAAVFPKRKQNLMHTCCSSLPPKNWRKQWGSRKKSHGPYRPFIKDAAWPTDAEGRHVHAPSRSRQKYRPSPLQKKILVIFGSHLVYANQYLLTSKNRFMWIQEWHMQLKTKAYKAWKTIWNFTLHNIPEYYNCQNTLPLEPFHTAQTS